MVKSLKIWFFRLWREKAWACTQAELQKADGQKYFQGVRAAGKE